MVEIGVLEIVILLVNVLGLNCRMFVDLLMSILLLSRLGIVVMMELVFGNLLLGLIFKMFIVLDFDKKLFRVFGDDEVMMLMLVGRVRRLLLKFIVVE